MSMVNDILLCPYISGMVWKVSVMFFYSKLKKFF